MSEIIRTEYLLQDNGKEYDTGKGIARKAYLVTLTKKDALARFDARKPVYFIYRNNRFYKENCRKIVKNRQYLINHYDVYHEQCGYIASQYVLSDTEQDVLNDLAKQSKMDCWFSFEVCNGRYRIEDRESNQLRSLHDGIAQLVEGLTYLQDYTWDQNGLRTICCLLDRFDLIDQVDYSSVEPVSAYMERMFANRFKCQSCCNPLSLDEMEEDTSGEGKLEDFQCPYCKAVGKIATFPYKTYSQDTVPYVLFAYEINLIKYLIERSSIDHLIRIALIDEVHEGKAPCKFLHYATGSHYPMREALQLVYNHSHEAIQSLSVLEREALDRLFDRYGVSGDTAKSVLSEPQKALPDKEQVIRNLIEALSTQCDRLDILRTRLEGVGIGKDLLDQIGFNVVLSIQSTEGQERIFFENMEEAKSELKRRYMQARKDPACDRGFLSDTHTYGYVVRDQDRFNSETLFEIDQIFGN